MRHNINGDGEDDRAVVLCRNAVQGLQIAQLSRKKDDLLISDSGRKKTNLKSCRTVHDHFSCHPQGSAGLVFSFSSNHLDAKLSKFKSKSIVLQDYLRSCISGCFCLSSHRPHELFRHPNVFHLKTNDNWLANGNGQITNVPQHAPLELPKLLLRRPRFPSSLVQLSRVERGYHQD